MKIVIELEETVYNRIKDKHETIWMSDAYAIWDSVVDGVLLPKGHGRLIDAELEQTRWIPCNERLPKENEYIGNVCKYYLIQDEYGDMHVAHLSNVGWIPMDSLKAIGDEVIAWRELPQSYKAESEEEGR